MSAHLKRAVIVTSIVALALAALAGPTAGAKPIQVESGLTPELRHQAAIRTEFGLEASPAHLRDVNSAQHSVTELGIPLSAAEAAEMKRREKLPSAISLVEGTLRNPILRSYGGVWIDQAHGGVIHFVFRSKDVAAARQSIKSVLPESTRFVVDDGAFSSAELDAVDRTINADISSDEAWTKWFSRSELDVKRNTVHLWLRAGTPAPIIDRVRSRFDGRGVTFEPPDDTVAVMNSRNHLSGPLYGGEWINGGVGDCTAGYGHSRGGPGDEKHFYLITAGHCGNYRYYQGKGAAGNYFGSAHNNGMIPVTSSTCDCVAVGPLPASATTTKVYTSDTALYAYGRTARSTDFAVGNKLCLSGARYADAHGGGIMCGEVQSSSVTIKYYDANFTLKDGFSTTIVQAQSGDSGGPYGSGVAFMGIHAATLVERSTGNPTGSLASKSTAIFTVTNTTPTY